MSNEQCTQDRVAALTTLIQLAKTRAEKDSDFKRAIGTMTADMDYVLAALKQDPYRWRLNRAFHTVHVPSFLTILAMLDDIDAMTSISPDERHDVLSAVNRAGQLAFSARERLEQDKLHKVKTEVDVLAEYARQPTQHFEKPSLFERTVQSARSLSHASLQTVGETVTAVPSALSNAKQNLSSTLDRAAAVPVLASNIQKSFAGVLTDTVSTPIAARLQAGKKALRVGAGAGVGLGVVAAVVFPPLLPVTAGVAVLAAMHGWSRGLEQANSLNAQERERRIAELKAQRREALLHLTNGAPSLQIDTDEINLSVDADSGQADAIILKGEHHGRRWSELSDSEKLEVASILTASADMLLTILQIGSGKTGERLC